LYVAFELSAKQWKLAMTSGFGVEPLVRTVVAGDLRGMERAIAQARTRFRLALGAPVVSCYEAGRDGFWIHRALTALGMANRVVDSASIEVNRHARRAKTDRLDALKLVRMLVRVWGGERDVWREVRVPSPADEAARQVSRERTALRQEQTRLINQMRGWLATWGCGLPGRRPAGWWTALRDWAGTPLPAQVLARLARAEARGALLETQVAALDEHQQAATAAAPTESPLARLVQLKGVATTGASVLLDEGLVWRTFRNRREIGGLLGFTPTPYASGASQHEQGLQSRRQCATAGRQHSTRLELGALATPERADGVVSRPVCRRWQTRPPDWNRRRRAQTGDRVVAVCHERHRAERCDPEGRLANSTQASHARGAHGTA
jgi:transposase